MADSLEKQFRLAAARHGWIAKHGSLEATLSAFLATASNDANDVQDENAPPAGTPGLPRTPTAAVATATPLPFSHITTRKRESRRQQRRDLQPELSFSSPLVFATPMQTNVPDHASGVAMTPLQPMSASPKAYSNAASPSPAPRQYRSAAAVADSSDDEEAARPVQASSRGNPLSDSSEESDGASPTSHKTPRRRLRRKDAAALADSSDDEDDKTGGLANRAITPASDKSGGSASDGSEAEEADYHDFDDDDIAEEDAEEDEESLGSFIVDDEDESLGEEGSDSQTEEEDEEEDEEGVEKPAAYCTPPQKSGGGRHTSESSEEEDEEDTSFDRIAEPRATARPQKTSTVASTPAQRRRAFVAKRDTLVAQYLKEFNTHVFASRLPADLGVEWSARLNTTAGRAILKRRGDVRSAHIELSTKVVDCEERLRSTFCHELCHVAAWLLDGVSKPPHGKVFKGWAARAMRYDRRLRVETCHSYDIDFKFRWQCQTDHCGAIIGRHSKSINVERQRCGRCHGKLRLLPRLRQDGTPCKPRQGNAFSGYVKRHFSRVKSDHPLLEHGEIMKRLGSMFKSMSVDEAD